MYSIYSLATSVVLVHFSRDSFVPAVVLSRRLSARPPNSRSMTSPPRPEGYAAPTSFLGFSGGNSVFTKVVFPIAARDLDIGINQRRRSRVNYMRAVPLDNLWTRAECRVWDVKEIYTCVHIYIRMYFARARAPGCKISRKGKGGRTRDETRER